MQKPRATRPVMATGLLLWLFLTGVPSGQGVTQTQPEPFDWQWALTQGGLTLVVLVLGWSYRKDLQRWADEKVELQTQVSDAKNGAMDERIGYQQARVDEAVRYNRNLEQISQRTNETLKATAEAISAHTMAVVLNTESAKQLAHVVERLDKRMERVEHQQ